MRLDPAFSSLSLDREPVPPEAVLDWEPTAATPAQVAFVGTYPPRRCGIATFTADVVDSLLSFTTSVTPHVIAIDRDGDASAYGDIMGVIAQHDPTSYAAAADRLNAAAIDAVWIQHEFGIFGGPDGEMLIDFVNRLVAPVIVTLHTVLDTPSERQMAIMRYLVDRAARLVVMSAHGRATLIELYGARPDRVQIIEHGAPDRPFGRTADYKARIGAEGRMVLTTFGLLGPGKGLETAIAALPAIIARHDDVLYRIIGATHPDLVAREGEAYRERLKALAAQLGVSDHIAWEDRFLDAAELLDQIEACDIYLTPYPNLQQSTSGTLSYAVALGKAVISTPYRHARELLANDVGVLIEPGDSDAVAAAVNHLLSNRPELGALQHRAYAAGRRTIWPVFAAASARLVEAVRLPPVDRAPSRSAPSSAAIFVMSDGVGMLQHAIGIVPDRRHGYCVDDNARALIAMHDAPHVLPADRERWAPIYASFLQHAWNPDTQSFRNFMSYDRRWLEEAGSDDSNGRALWALGVTAQRARCADLRRWGRSWFDIALSGFARVDAPRALALAAIGAAAVHAVDPSHDGARALLDRTGTLLAHLLERQRRPDWSWFEVVLAYDNPRLPQALLLAGRALGRVDWIHAGQETLAWIAARQISAQGHFRPVGSESFGRDYTQMPFDQQPLEAQAAIEAAMLAYAVTGEEHWRQHAERAWRWFFGSNDRGAMVADMRTGRCRDGVTPHGVNANCGAESILAFHAAYAAMAPLQERAAIPAARGTNCDQDVRDPSWAAHS